MEPSGPEPSAYVGNLSRPVESGQSSSAILDQERGGLGGVAHKHRRGQPELLRDSFDPVELTGRWFMRYQDEPHLRTLASQCPECAQQHFVVGMPGRARHNGPCIRTEGDQWILWRHLGDLGRDAVVARIAQSLDSIPFHAELDQAVRIVL